MISRRFLTITSNLASVQAFVKAFGAALNVAFN